MKQWLREFLVNHTVGLPEFGLCYNIKQDCGGKALFEFYSAIGEKEFPIYDKSHPTLDNSYDQFALLPHYKGKQLKLRLELALNVLAPDKAELSDDARKLSKWLKQFVIHRQVKNPSHGLCFNVKKDCGNKSAELFYSFIEDKEFPIHDKHANGSAGYQYTFCNLYEGRQLELRVKLAIKVLEELHNGTAN